MHTPPAAILFDFGGTIVREPSFDTLAGCRALLAAARSPAPVPPQEIDAEVGRILKLVWPTVDGGCVELPASSLRRLIYDRFGVSWDITDLEQERVFWRAGCSPLEPTPGLRRLLERSRVPMAIVSNFSFSSALLRELLEELQLAKRFSFHMASSEYGLRKPHPELFLTACARLGLPPERVWYCGDRLEKDVAGALAAGLGAVWYRPGEPPLPHPGDPTPDLVVRHWDELPLTGDHT